MDNVLQSLDITITVKDNNAVSRIMALTNALGTLQTKINSLSTRQFSATMTRVEKRAEQASSRIKNAFNLSLPDIKAPTVKGIPKSPSLQNTADLKNAGTANTTLKTSSKVWGEYSNAVKDASSKLSVVNSASRSASSGQRALANSASTTTKQVEAELSTWQRFRQKISSVRNLITSVHVVMAQLMGIGRQTVGEASDYIEAVNLFNLSMGSYAEKAGAYATRVQDVLGIDVSNWMQQQGSLQKMALGYGMTEKEAYRLSQTMTNLAYDYASFFNLDFDKSFEKIRSAIAGQSRPMRQLGVDVTQASLAQTALNHGIKESVSDMSQAEKAYLRAIAIQDAAGNVQNDMARTIWQPANAMRVLGQLASQAGRAIGFIFIPLLAKIVPIAQAVVVILRNVAQAIANFFGVKIPDFKNTTIPLNKAGSNLAKNTGNASKNLGSAGNSAGKIAKHTKKANDNTKKTAKQVKKIKRELAGFDVLNVLSFSKPSSTKSKKAKTPSTPSGGGGGGGGGGVGGGGGGSLGGIDFWDQLNPYDLTKGAEKKVQQLVEKLKTLMKIALFIGEAIWSWKIAPAFLKFLMGDSLIGGGLLRILEGIGTKAGALGAKIFPFAKETTTVTGAFASMAVAILIVVRRLTGAVKNSELFRTGVKAVAKFIGLIAKGLMTFVTWTSKVGKAMNLNKEVVDGIKDVIAVIAGLLLSVIFPPAGGLVLIVEGIIIGLKVIGALMKNSTVVEALKKVKENLGKIFHLVGESIRSSLIKTMHSLRAIWEIIGPIVKFVAKIVAIILGACLGAIFAVILTLIVAIAKVVEIVAKGFQKLVEGIEDFVRGLLKAVNRAREFLGLPPIELKTDKKSVKKVTKTIKDATKGTKKVTIKAKMDAKSKKNIDKINKTKNKTATTTLKGKNTGSSKKVTKAYDHLKDKKPKVSLNATETKGFKTIKKEYPKIKNKPATITAKGAKADSFKKGFGSDGTGGAYGKPKNDDVTKTYKAKVPKIDMKVSKKSIAGKVLSYFASFSTKGKGVTGYATGGFPKFGELFMANENGIEMMGNIGNKPAVANNEQIVSAVSAGVTNAIVSGLRMASTTSSGGSNQNLTINIPLYLDNEQVAKETVKYINGQIQRYGVSPITG